MAKVQQNLDYVLGKLDRCIGDVSEYLVGITANPNEREKAQRGAGFDDIVILACGMSRQEAISLEGDLFRAIQASNKRTKRWIRAQERITNPEKRHLPSSGGKTDDDRKDYVVYIARCY